MMKEPMGTFTSSKLDTSRPLFAYKVRASTGEGSSKQKRVDGFLLVAWFVVTTLRLQCEHAESETRYLAYLTPVDDQERFMRVADFRFVVGKCYDELKRSRGLTGYYLLRSIVKNVVLPVKGPLVQQREDLGNPLCAVLAELGKTLDTIKEDLNKELKVTIGAVQVREAQLTRKQTRVTARQTTWTVALTVLAAVYLPMTLVTGIFGMNITEINSEATTPNAWWAVGA